MIQNSEKLHVCKHALRASPSTCKLPAWYALHRMRKCHLWGCSFKRFCHRWQPHYGCGRELTCDHPACLPPPSCPTCGQEACLGEACRGVECLEGGARGARSAIWREKGGRTLRRHRWWLGIPLVWACPQPFNGQSLFLYRFTEFIKPKEGKDRAGGGEWHHCRLIEPLLPMWRKKFSELSFGEKLTILFSHLTNNKIPLL